jgi:hypothetical protein
MTYAYTSSTDTGPLTATIHDKCTSLGTTTANCHATVTVTVGDGITILPSRYVVSEAAYLGYAQVPITAGPTAALRSVSSCSANAGVTLSSSTTSQTPPVSSRPVTETGEASPVIYPASGLSTGAKIGIGVWCRCGRRCAASRRRSVYILETETATFSTTI